MIRILFPLLFLALGLFVSSPDANAQDEVVPAVTAVTEEEEKKPEETSPVQAPHAETAQTPPPAAESNPKTAESEMPDSEEAAEDQEVTIVKDPFAGDYVRGTPQNLSKLYWRLGVFDGDDDAAVDNFMMINECRIFQNNINNDFEW